MSKTISKQKVHKFFSNIFTQLAEMDEDFRKKVVNLIIKNCPDHQKPEKHEETVVMSLFDDEIKVVKICPFCGLIVKKEG